MGGMVPPLTATAEARAGGHWPIASVQAGLRPRLMGWSDLRVTELSSLTVRGGHQATSEPALTQGGVRGNPDLRRATVEE